MSDLPEYKAFAECVGDTFEIGIEGIPPLATELVEAVESRHAGPTRTAFTLLFRGPPEPILAQQSFQVRHPRLGQFDLFLVPVGADQAGVRYEAVFN